MHMHPYVYPKNWYWLTIFGILLMLVGAAAIATPYFTTIAFFLVLGWLLCCSGIIQIIFAFSTWKTGGFLTHLLLGIFITLLGILIITFPVDAAASVTLLLAIFFLTLGLFRIFASAFTRFENWPWFLVLGIIDVILGVLILERWPSSSLWVIGLFVGLEFLFTGIAFISTSFVIKRLHTQYLENVKFRHEQTDRMNPREHR